MTPRWRRCSAGALALAFLVPFIVTFDRTGIDAATVPLAPGNTASTSDARQRMTPGWIESVAGVALDGAVANDVNFAMLTIGISVSALPYAVRADGITVVADAARIFEITSNGRVRRIAGIGVPAEFGDGSPAIESGFQNIARLDAWRDGSLVVTEIPRMLLPPSGPRTIRFRRIDPNGIVTTVADVDRFDCPKLDDAPDTAKGVCVVADARMAEDGTIFETIGFTTQVASTAPVIATTGRLAVLRPGASGPSSLLGPTPTGGCPAYDPPTMDNKKIGELSPPMCLGTWAPGRDGELYVVQKYAPDAKGPPGVRVLRVSADGTVTSIAGNGDAGVTNDGRLAGDAALGLVAQMQLTDQGLIVAIGREPGDRTRCTGGCMLRRVGSLGVIERIAGGTADTRDGVSALDTRIGTDFQASPSGSRITLGGDDSPSGSVVSFRSFAPKGIISTIGGRNGQGTYLQSPEIDCSGGACTLVPPTISVGPDDRLHFYANLFPVVLGVDGSLTPDNGLLPTVNRHGVATGTDGSVYAFGERIVTVPPGIPVLFIGIHILRPDGSRDQFVVNGGSLLGPWTIAVDPQGRVYVVGADHITRYERVGGTWKDTLYAGSSAACESPLRPCAGTDGADATKVPLFRPTSLAFGPDGSGYIAEPAGSQVRRIDPSGHIHRFAGTGVYGSSGDTGPAVDAALARPTGVAVGPDGAVYIADLNASRVRAVSTTGIIDTVAGDGTYLGSPQPGPARGPVLSGPVSVVVDSQNYLYIVDAGTGALLRVAPGVPLPEESVADITSRFVPVPPTRILDTRVAIGGTGPVGARSGVDLGVTGGLSANVDVPPNASAVVLNLTMTEAAAPGFVQVLPTGRAEPGSSSNLNVEQAGQTIANLVTSRVGDGGKVTVYTQGGGQLVADLVGYYEPSGTAVADGRFVPLPPARVLDTRTGLGQRSVHKPQAGESVVLTLLNAGGVPATGVSAVALNLTVTESTAPGFVQAVPTEGATAVGASSNINAVRADQTIANLAIVPLGADGSVTLYTQNGTHLVADVQGYYTDSSAPASRTGLFVPVRPTRLLDTRDRGPRPEAGATIDVDPISTGAAVLGVTADALGALSLNVTATEAAKAGYVQALPTGRAELGSSSSLNVERSDQTIANAAQVPVGDGGAVTLFTQNGTHLVIDLTGWFLS